jgi:starch synthase (maltosyl-transferring)
MAAEPERQRVVIEGVQPEIDSGRFPIKRVVGERVTVEADAFTDGHDAVCCVLLWRPETPGDAGWREVPSTSADWREVPMQALGNDRWRGSFTVSALGRYRYTLLAWVDPFRTWRRDLKKRVEAGQEVAVDLAIGAGYIEQAGKRAQAAGRRAEARVLAGLARDLARGGDRAAPLRLALDGELGELMDRHSDRHFATRYAAELAVVVDRPRARFGSWYEMFPRSCGPTAGETGRHGTFDDCAARLRYVAEMGFDVVYLPPIHPIGKTYRKGRNNAVRAAPGEVGSPWAIGGAEGGHKAIHPELGDLAGFRRLLAAARDLGLEVALDLAFQCSPDHPYVREHPEWFRHRPDGSIQYAENPPKKYEDIYPFDFESADREGLWAELKSVVDHWIGEGVRIFRVDNPHTKPLPFWEWLIGEVKREHPETIFLAEAFTRPKIMYRLAKLGFTQSYTYFAWRNARWELAEYFTEITRPPVVEFFRANVWPNTPDILTERLQYGGRPAFAQRLVLAATLAASYGIYGPPFELAEHVAREPGSEEYLDSEKYQLRRWDLDRPDSLAELVARVNRIRRENPALQSDRSLRFHGTDNEQLLCYSKASEGGENVVLMVVNLDPHHLQAGWVELDLPELGLKAGEGFQVHDLLSGARYLWQGARNYVQLDPASTPAHVFRVRRRLRSERDFDYFT